MVLPQLSIHFSNHDSALSTVQDIVRAEAAGLRRAWISEDLFFRGALPLAAAALARTSTIELAFGVLAPQHRHPASLAMDIRTLRDLAPDRVIVGLGAGVAERGVLLDQPASPPLRIVDEAVSGVRTLLAGDQLDQDGVLHRSVGLRLTGEVSPEVPPFYVAAVGPKALAQAGRAMDGVILTLMCSREHARWAAARVAEAARAAGREQVPIVAYLPIAVHQDRARAKDRMRTMFAGYVAKWSQVSFLSRLFLDWSDLDVERMALIRDAVATGAELHDLIPDELIDQYCIAGTPEECVRLLHEFGETGITEVALEPGEDLDAVLTFLDGVASSGE